MSTSALVLACGVLAAFSTPEEDALVAALLAGDADGAARAVAHNDSVDARRVRAALLDLRGDAAAVELKAALPPLPPPPVIAPKRPLSGGGRALGFVAASVARVRKQPSASAPVVATIPIGTPVELMRGNGDFTLVRVGRRTVRASLTGGVATLVTPARFPAPHGATVMGFVATALLDGAPPELRALLDAAARADAQTPPDHARAAALRSRAAALDPHDRALRAALIRSALRAGDMPLAVQTGLITADDPLPLEGFGFSDGWPYGAIAFALGCRGDVTGASLVTEKGWQRAHKDACLVNVDARDACGPRDARPDPGNTSPAEEAAFQQALARDVRAHAERVEKRRAALAALRAQLGTPLVLIDLERSAGSSRWPHLWLTRAPVTPTDAGCGGDNGALGPPARARLRLPRTTEDERELRIILDANAPDAALWLVEATPTADTPPPAPSGSVLLPEGEPFGGVEMVQWDRGDRGDERTEFAFGPLPLARAWAPSFCDVMTCVP